MEGAKNFRNSVVIQAILAFGVLLVIPVAFEHLRGLRAGLAYPIVCEKDHIQDFAMMSAIHAGQSPYMAVPDLVTRFVPECEHVPLNSHPSPHPIVMAALTSPFANALSYPQSYTLWASLEFLGLILAIVLLFYLCERKPPWQVIGLWMVLVLAAFPSFDDLYLGQVNFTLLALFVAAIIIFRRDETAGGFLFGVALAIKFFGWPIALLLLLRKRWKAFAGMVCGFLVLQIVAVAVAGVNTVILYYQTIAPQLSNFYAGCGLNQSLFTLPAHLFRGFTKHCYNWPDDGALALPFLASPWLAEATSMLLPLIILASVLYFGWRSRRIEDALVAMVCFSAITSPVTWGHSVVLTFILLRCLYVLWPILFRSYIAFALFAIWVTSAVIIPTYIPGSPTATLLAALHNVSVIIASLSATALALLTPTLLASVKESES